MSSNNKNLGNILDKVENKLNKKEENLKSPTIDSSNTQFNKENTSKNKKNNDLYEKLEKYRIKKEDNSKNKCKNKITTNNSNNSRNPGILKSPHGLFCNDPIDKVITTKPDTAYNITARPENHIKYYQFLPKKRFLSQKERNDFEEEARAIRQIDKGILELRNKRLKREAEERKKEEKEEEKRRKLILETMKPKKKTNMLFEELGINEDKIKELEKKENNDEQKIKPKKFTIDIDEKEEFSKNFTNIKSLSFFDKNNIKKYSEYKVYEEDIYKNVLSVDFYYNKPKYENIPDSFDNELHYRYIWIPNFFAELKCNLLNEKAEKSDLQNYKNADVKIYLTFIKDIYKNFCLFKINVNKNLEVFRKKIFKEKDLIALYPENEKLNSDDITLLNKKKLNYFLAIVTRENDYYNDLYIIISKSDVEKFKINNLFNSQSSSKYYKIKYLNNIISSLREFNALLCLELQNFKSILSPKALLKNKPLKNINTTQNFRKELFLNNLKTKKIFNQSQIEVILKANNMKENEILLIQGPPGTGKTHTILGLISLFSLDKNSKILVCTQSNTAIDEICSRLFFKGLFNENFSQIKSNYIRFGYLDRKDKEKKYLDTNQAKQLEKMTLEYLIDNKFKDLLDHASQEKESIQKQINQLLNDKDKNHVKLRELEIKKQNLLKTLSQNKFQKQNYEFYLLSNAQIICTTLNSSGNERLKKQNLNFEYLIIDEACQCVEPSCLIPLSYGIKKLILVGDHKQLPATIFNSNANITKYNRSLFERLIDNDIPRHILTVQYRMQTNIRQFISKLFYDDKLLDSPDKSYINKINNNPFYSVVEIKKNFSYFDISGVEIFEEISKSYYNMKEIDFTFELIKCLNSKLKNFSNNYQFGIITPYQAQVKTFKEEKNKFSELSDIDLMINTVDSFQGKERDIIILSTVRSNKNNAKNGNEAIGFLSDFRRMNVALSRAKLGCFIVGNSKQFENDKYWKKLIEFCKEKKSFFEVKSKEDNTNQIKKILI